MVGGCSGPSTPTPIDPDIQFGHRYTGRSPDGDHIVSITEPNPKSQYSYFPATFHRVIVRSNPVMPQQNAVPVEILVKGNLPDLCMELHQFDHTRTENIITATLEMRRPITHGCKHIIYPYRVYLPLDDTFTQGHYTLKLNDRIIPFTVIYTEEE